jgi:hypothetical protein
MIDRQNTQLLTKAKIKWADSTNLKGSATIKLHCSLTVKRFEIPASLYIHVDNEVFLENSQFIVIPKVAFEKIDTGILHAISGCVLKLLFSKLLP